MKKLFKLGLVGLLLSVLIGTSSCYKKDIDNLEDRVTTLEEALASLQSDVAALKNGAFASISWDAASGVLTLTNVDGTSKTVTIGPIPTYDITLTGNTLLVNGVNKGTVNIPNPTLTLVDGYLHVNGTNTNIPIPAAATPLDLQVKVEDGQYVFYNGTTKLGATIPKVEFKDGGLYIGTTKVLDTADFLAGDAIVFQKEGTTIVGVTLTVNGEEVYLPVIYQGLTLTSLNIIPNYIHDGVPAVKFYSMQEYRYTLAGNGTETNVGVATSGNPVWGLSSTPEVSFRYNPTGADVQNSKITWNFINRGILTTRATGDRTNLVKYVAVDGKPFTMDAAGGAIIFKLVADRTASQYVAPNASFETVYDYMNLKAVAPVDINDDASAKQDIVSPEVKVLFNDARALIGDKKAFEANPTLLTKSFAFPMAIKTNIDALGTAANLVATFPYPANAVAHEVAFDKSHDLLDYVFAFAGTNGEFKTFDELDITDYRFTFESVSFVPGASATPVDNTDQKFFVALNGSVFSIQDYAAQSAINRTPIFRANIVSNATGKIVATHFLKFVITHAAPTTITWPTINLGNIPYLSLYTQNGTLGRPGIPSAGPQLPLATNLGLNVTGGTAGTYAEPAYFTALTSAPNITWQRINTDIYAALGLSHAEFIAQYDIDGISIETDHTTKGKTGNPRVLPDRAIKVSAMHDENQGTSPLAFYIHPQTRFGPHTWTIVIERKDGRASVRIPVMFNLTAPEEPAFDPLYVVSDVTQVMGKLDQTTTPEEFLMQATLSESFAGNPGGMMKDFERNVVDKIFRLSNLPLAFTVGGSANDITGFQVHRFAFGFTSVGATHYTETKAARANEASGATNGEIFQFSGVMDVKSFLGQDIHLTKPIDVAQWSFPTVTFRSTYENMEDVDKVWTVRFFNPLAITVNNAILPTRSEPSIVLVRSLINTISVKGTQVFANGNFITTPAPASVDLKARYAIPNVENFGWVMDPNNRFGPTSALFLSSEPTVTAPVASYTPAVAGANIYTLFWENKGTTLVDDVNNTLNVTVQTPYAKLTVPITVTVQK